MAGGPIAPALLWAEIRNLLISAERRGRLDPGMVEEGLAVVEALEIALDGTPASDHVLALARRHRLTIYDALYLELALRRGAALATRDEALAAAARAEGVALLDQSRA
jgi:predicted nucleic acid-binding protein